MEWKLRINPDLFSLAWHHFEDVFAPGNLPEIRGGGRRGKTERAVTSKLAPTPQQRVHMQIKPNQRLL